MKKLEFLKSMKILSVSYNKDFNEETLGVWYAIFKNYDYKLFINKIKQIIEIKRFMPSIAEIKFELEKDLKPQFNLNADIEWDRVLELRNQDAFNEWNLEGLEKKLNPITYQVCRMIGFRRLDEENQESIKWTRKEFIEIFNNKLNYNYESIISIPYEKQKELENKNYES